MFKLLEKVPRHCCVAVSGGVDSMGALDFLRRSHQVTVLHYNHATPFSSSAESLVEKYCDRYDIRLVTSTCQEEIPKGVSKEAWWRDRRYEFFESATDLKVVMAHHLDDAVESWLFTSMHGNPALIPQKRGKYIRPFLATRKHFFQSWCKRKGVDFIEDPSNVNIAFRRNYIRHKMIEHALMINPGIYKTIKKKYIFGDNNAH